MIMLTIEINLKNIKDEKDLIHRFFEVLQLPQEENRTYASWDALYDYMCRLDSDSKLISQMNPIPEHVHLVIKNYNDVKVIDQMKQGNFGSYNDYSVFNKLLIDLTDNHPECRGEGAIVSIKITFEVHHGDW